MRYYGLIHRSSSWSTRRCCWPCDKSPAGLPRRTRILRKSARLVPTCCPFPPQEVHRSLPDTEITNVVIFVQLKMSTYMAVPCSSVLGGDLKQSCCSTSPSYGRKQVPFTSSSIQRDLGVKAKNAMLIWAYPAGISASELVTGANHLRVQMNSYSLVHMPHGASRVLNDRNFQLLLHVSGCLGPCNEKWPGCFKRVYDGRGDHRNTFGPGALLTMSP